MSKVTFGYVVGGNDRYYVNLARALTALSERVRQPYKVIVIDLSNKFNTFNKNIKVIRKSVDYLNHPGRNWFQPHVWALRYELFKYLETEYCFYMDVDTVLVNDRVDELIEESSDQFLVTQHWWVPTLADFLSNVAVDLGKSKDLLPTNTTSYSYPASGCFLFKRDAHDYIFEKFFEIHSSIFSESENPNNVTDEFILCLTLNQLGGWRFTNGAFNHTAAESLMPLTMREGVFFGKNPFNSDFVPIFIFHSALENINSLRKHSPTYIEQIESVMYVSQFRRFING